MATWLSPVFDNLELLVPSKAKKVSRNGKERVAAGESVASVYETMRYGYIVN